MASLIWLRNKVPGLHQYGLELLTTDKYTAENFLHNEIQPLCKELDCKYFIQGLKLVDRGVSWVFVEFFGEGSEDNILLVIEAFNKKYYNRKLTFNAYHGTEIMMEEPSTELLKELKLI